MWWFFYVSLDLSKIVTEQLVTGLHYDNYEVHFIINNFQCGIVLS